MRVDHWASHDVVAIRCVSCGSFDTCARACAWTEDVPNPTTGLDFQIARISVSSDASNEVQSTFQFWEIGGGRTMSKMVEICLKPENIQSAMAVIVLDLSKVMW